MYKTHGSFGRVISFLTHPTSTFPSHTPPPSTLAPLNHIQMAYQLNNTTLYPTQSTVNAGGFDTGPHIVQAESSMVDEIDMALGGSLDNNLANFDATHGSDYGERRECAFSGLVSNEWTPDATGPTTWCPTEVDLNAWPSYPGQYASGFGTQPQMPYPPSWWGNYMATPGIFPAVPALSTCKNHFCHVIDQRSQTTKSPIQVLGEHPGRSIHELVTSGEASSVIIHKHRH